MPRRATNSETKLSPVNFRTTQERRARLEERANASGRSLAQEVERLVDFALDYEERVGGEDMVAVLAIIGEAAARVLSTCAGLDEFRTRARLVGAIKTAAELALPIPDVNNSEDLKRISQAAEYLLILMPRLSFPFNPNPLLDLRDAQISLTSQEYQNYTEMLNQALENRPDPGDKATIQEGLTRLEEAQSRAMMLCRSLESESQIGSLRAFSAVREVYERRASKAEE